MEGEVLKRSAISFKLNWIKNRLFKFSNSAAILIILFTSLREPKRQVKTVYIYIYIFFVSAGPVAECCNVRKATKYPYLEYYPLELKTIIAEARLGQILCHFLSFCVGKQVHAACSSLQAAWLVSKWNSFTEITIA